MIDLNSDLGENSAGRRVADDEAMIPVISSANVACGFHAGDPAGIAATMRAAAAADIAVGAHPGYRDWENFGRVALEIDSPVLQAEVEYQLGAAWALARAAGTRVSYVKPHGALYNTIAENGAVGADVIAAIKAVDPGLVVLALAGSGFVRQARAAGLLVAEEAFADRAYTSAGALVSRAEAGAVLTDPTIVADRVLRLVTDHEVEAIDGTTLRLDADSVCVHGDSPGAVHMARHIRRRLESQGVSVEPFTGR